MLDEIRKSIEGTFQTAWGDTTPIAFQNVAFSYPSNKEFVRITVGFGKAFQQSMGSQKLARQFGVVMFQVFTGNNTGTARNSQLCDTIAAIFRYQQFKQDGVTINFGDANPVKVPVTTDYMQINLNIEFSADQLF